MAFLNISALLPLHGLFIRTRYGTTMVVHAEEETLVASVCPRRLLVLWKNFMKVPKQKVSKIGFFSSDKPAQNYDSLAMVIELNSSTLHSSAHPHHFFEDLQGTYISMYPLPNHARLL